DVGQDRLDDMRIVGDPKLVRHGQKKGVGLRDGLVSSELIDESVGLGSIAAAEDRSRLFVDKANLIPVLAAAAEVSAIAIVCERKDAAADRHARLAHLASLFPRGAEGPDLGGLLDVERLAGLIALKRRALQGHPQFC